MPADLRDLRSLPSEHARGASRGSAQGTERCVDKGARPGARCPNSIAPVPLSAMSIPCLRILRHSLACLGAIVASLTILADEVARAIRDALP